MNKLSVKCFGVGDGAPCADRNHSAYLYDFADQTLLVDCGEPLCRSYKASGRDFGEIDRILISHYHFDHIGGFFMFMQGSWLEGRSKPLPVHLPANGIPAVKKLLEAACLFKEVLPFRLDFIALEPGQTIDMDPIRIHTFPTSHLEHFKRHYEEKYPGNFEAYGFVFETDRGRFCHSADIGTPNDLEPALAKPLDLLTCELSHFKPEDLFQRLQQAEIGTLVLTHVGRPYWEKLNAIREKALSMLPGKKVIFATDQQEIAI